MERYSIKGVFLDTASAMAQSPTIPTISSSSDNETVIMTKEKETDYMYLSVEETVNKSKEDNLVDLYNIVDLLI